MKMTMEDIKKRFHIDKPNAAMFFLLLTMLPPGDYIEAINGRIEKIDDDTLKLIIDEKTLSELSSNFLAEDISSYEEMFGHLPMD